MSIKFRLAMQHTMRTICTAFLLLVACAPAVAQVDPLSFVHIIPVTDGNAATDDRGFDDYINSTSFKIQSLVTVDKYQFIAYYDQGTSNANRNVTIGAAISPIRRTFGPSTTLPLRRTIRPTRTT